MVRGVSRRVIVVKPEQPALFEQAIFLVRDYNAAARRQVREACASQTAICRADGGREERRTVFLCLPDFGLAHCSSAPFGRDGACFVKQIIK